jgi:choline dehydrogenase-like flavoprotein
MTHTVPKEFLIGASEASQVEWDAVIIGAGMGGSNVAYALARQGYRVCLIEKGRATFGADATVGVETEQTDPQTRLAHGRWPTQLRTRVDGRVANIWAPLGCGVGGSTLLYAAALQRLRPSDLGPQRLPDGQEVRWPFSYAALEPHYRAVEDLFSVCGTPDPLEHDARYSLRPPPAMSDCDRHCFQEFQRAGLHPYRLHAAIEYGPACMECAGRLCASSCKRDAFNACIEPALHTGNLRILAGTTVERLQATRHEVTGVQISAPAGASRCIRGRVVVLSAGAYFSPALLLKSASNVWPDGLANDSNLVGRNLMFHASEFIAVWQKKKHSRQGANKTIALRDFYEADGTKMGEFQSTGLTAGYGSVLYALRLLFDQSPLRKLRPLRQLLRIPAYAASRLYGEASIFATIVEDFPYAENRIVLDDDAASGIRVEYRIHDEFRARVAEFTRKLRRALPALHLLPINVGVTLNYGHPCGTVVAGEDPATSVLDENCKAHSLDNLYVVDSAFMPTSGGTNPSLTIAANAQRVAHAMASQLSSTTARTLASS